MSDALQLLQQYGFAQQALLAGVLCALLGAVVGFFVVLRRMAFVAVGVSHAALGGVAVGVLLGQSPVLWAIVFSVAVALGMAALGRRGVHEDTAMGIFFPAAMAFGVLLMGFSDDWQRDLLSYLFGSILWVQPADLWLLAGVTLVVLVLVGLFFKELLFISFDEESAHAAGVPVGPFRSLLLVLVAVTVVVAIKVVGVVLVSALLVIPTATVAQVTRHWLGLLLGSVVVALVSVVGGLLISLSATRPIAPGPAAVLTATVLFGLATLVARFVLERSTTVGAEPAAEPAPTVADERPMERAV